MQQASEVPTTDAATADVITSAAAAARKCPECESLMLLETEDQSGHHEPEEDGPFEPLLRCPNVDCGHIEPLGSADADVAPVSEGESAGAEVPGDAPADAKAPARASTSRSMACQACGLQILVELRGGEGDGPIRGFSVVAIEKVGDAGDVSMETTFGRSANGFPLCPKDRVALLPLGPVPVGEAFRAVADALQDTEKPAGQMRLPHTAPPFNEHEALQSIYRKRHEVEALEREYEDRKTKAGDAKKRLEEGEAQFRLLVAEFERRQKEVELEARGRLMVGQDSPCLYEQRTSKPCPTCRVELKKAKAEEGDDVDPEYLETLSLDLHLRHRGIFIEDMALIPGSVGKEHALDLDALRAFAYDESQKTPPADVAARAHVAGPKGDDGQRCTRCSMLLHNHIDEAEAGETPYPEGALVGTDCVGEPGSERATAAAAEDNGAPEPARLPQRRHKTPKDAAKAKSKATREERAAKAAAPAKPTRTKRTRSR